MTAYLALGSNLATRLGSPTATLAQALVALKALPKTKLLAASSVHITKPDNALGGDFANSVCKLETDLNAYELLHALQAIEIDFGRPAPNSPSRNLQGLQGMYGVESRGLQPARTLDLDILLYGDARIDSPALTVPHPRMHERRFVMLPLQELMPVKAR